jgi:hypothetical protein
MSRQLYSETSNFILCYNFLYRPLHDTGDGTSDAVLFIKSKVPVVSKCNEHGSGDQLH